MKSFGHRYLNEDESLILLTLGTTDLRDTNVPVELNKVSLAKSFATELIPLYLYQLLVVIN